MTKEWLITEEDKRIAFLHDCRIFNGGSVASEEEQAMWEKNDCPTNKNDITYAGPKFIDRLRG